MTPPAYIYESRTELVNSLARFGVNPESTRNIPTFRLVMLTASIEALNDLCFTRERRNELIRAFATNNGLTFLPKEQIAA